MLHSVGCGADLPLTVGGSGKMPMFAMAMSFEGSKKEYESVIYKQISTVW